MKCTCASIPPAVRIDPSPAITSVYTYIKIVDEC